jgi:tetratricopeptide (TPR) repeat protein
MDSFFSLLSPAARSLFAAVFLVAGWYSATLARAEALFRKSTPTCVSAAISLIPYNSRYLVGLAALQPEHSSELLRRALTLNECDSRSWVQLGLDAEFQRGNWGLAEQYYLRAAEVNHMFYTASNLANFYFRYQRRNEFFEWAHRSLQMAYSDPTFLFVEIWSLSDDRRFNGSLIPERVTMVLAPYARFLVQTNHLDAAEDALSRLLNRSTIDRYDKELPSTVRFVTNQASRDLFGTSLDRLLAANRYQAAQRVWKELVEANWLQTPVPTVAVPLTNGDFRQPVFSHGFDWAFWQIPGSVTFDQIPASARLRISFDGKEPDALRLLHQFVVLEPNRRYRLKWTAESDSISKGSGFQWRLLPLYEQGPAETSDLVSPDLLGLNETGTWDFSAPAQPLNLLILDYARRPGTVRPEGELSLSGVTLSLSPQ